MKLRFTKMQGAGNDFVVLDATSGPLPLDAALCRRLGDRRFGVGADQILVVEGTRTPGVDFRYRIFNGATGEEVEHCGNGARCFARFVRQRGLIDRDVVRVETVNNRLELRLQSDGRVTVDMNRPIFDLGRVPFDPAGLDSRPVRDWVLWQLPLLEPMTGPVTMPMTRPMTDGLAEGSANRLTDGLPESVEVAVLSMGNPHAVLRVEDVDRAPVGLVGPRIETHPRFPRRTNVGFLQVVSRGEVKLRVHERDAGETLACGTGACAAVVAGIRLGWLDAEVDVHTRGGLLTISWDGPSREGDAPVMMTGPAETVFEGEIEL